MDDLKAELYFKKWVFEQTLNFPSKYPLAMRLPPYFFRKYNLSSF